MCEPEPEEEVDPCAGKSCGDSCSLCAGRPGCVETAVLKACNIDGECPGWFTHVFLS